MPPGKLRDYGADLTLRSYHAWTVSADSCQQLYQRKACGALGYTDAGLVFLGAGVSHG